MAYPTKTQQPIAAKNSTRADLSGVHVTTGDFMQYQISKYIELSPKQSIEVNHRLFSRLDPMTVPTFGRGRIHNRAFFVPYRTIYIAFNDFINDVPHVWDSGTYSIPRYCPFIYYGHIVNTFLNLDFATPVGSPFENPLYDPSAAEGESFDFIIDVVGGLYQAYRFTRFGRWAYKLLRSLGYNWTFISQNTEVTSAMPFLAACKVYMDFYFPSQYANDEDSAWLNSLFTINSYDVDDYQPFGNEVSLIRALKLIYRVSYDTDYFTSAWDNPNGPNNSLSSAYEISDIDGSSNFESSVKYGNLGDFGVTNAQPEINTEVKNETATISQYMLNALRSLNDYLKRHQIAGSRAFDRFLARFGVKLESEKLNRCVYVGDMVQNLEFGDVTSTASTDGATLGAYAGKGVSDGQGNYTFNTNEWGMFIVVSTIIPEPIYFEGQDRIVKHLTRLDFLTPEFDALGVQGMYKSELYVPIDAAAFKGVYDDFLNYKDSLFGFTPRYAESKVGRSQITGDFLCRSVNVGKDAWYFGRFIKPKNFNDAAQPLNLFRHNYQFIMGEDADQYNRIFTVSGDDATDHFNIIHIFDIKSNIAAKSLYDDYEFQDEDKSPKVSMNIGGTTMN